VVKVTGSSNQRVSLAALICLKPGCRPRLIYRVHHGRGHGKERRKGFTENDYAQLLDAAHQQLAGPVVVVCNHLNANISGTMTELIAARDWLTVYRLPPYAHELNPMEGAWANTKNSPANLPGSSTPDQLAAIVKNRLKRIQYRPALIDAFLA
jgi:DDE superfamily endonuclease